MNMITPKTWTPERKAEVVRLYQDLSRNELAARMGVTKGALSGLINRMGLTRSDCNPIQSNPEKAKKARAKNAARRELQTVGKRGQNITPANDQPKVENGCRFIAGDVRGRPEGVEIDDLYCNAPRQKDSSYCAEHHALCTTIVPKRKRRGQADG